MLKGKCPIIDMHERDGPLAPQSARQETVVYDKVSIQNARVNLLRYPVKRGNRKLKC